MHFAFHTDAQIKLILKFFMGDCFCMPLIAQINVLIQFSSRIRLVLNKF